MKNVYTSESETDEFSSLLQYLLLIIEFYSAIFKTLAAAIVVMQIFICPSRRSFEGEIGCSIAWRAGRHIKRVQY